MHGNKNIKKKVALNSPATYRVLLFQSQVHEVHIWEKENSFNTLFKYKKNKKKMLRYNKHRGRKLYSNLNLHATH